MNEYFMKHVAELCQVQVAEIGELPQEELVRKYILPRGVSKCGSEQRRVHGISDEFMAFMSRFGELCYSLDGYTGEVLYQLALQRIVQGAVPCETKIYVAQEFAEYAATEDPRRLFTPGCWSFLRDQMKHLLTIDGLREPARAVLFAILDHVTAEGEILSPFVYPQHQMGIPDPRDLFAWAKNCATDKRCLIVRFLLREHFSQPQLWRHYLWFWHDEWARMYEHEKNDFFHNIGASGWWKRRKIRKEILGYAQ